MSTPRFTARVPSGRLVTVAWLSKHRLRFHKNGYDGSGKCDAEYTNNELDIIYGIVFEMSVTEKLRLDNIEKVGNGYDEKNISVFTKNNKTLEVVTYCATNINSSLEPYHWYKHHVLRGAREHYLPLEYISMIEAINSIPDPNKQRHEKELSIYRGIEKDPE